MTSGTTGAVTTRFFASLETSFAVMTTSSVESATAISAAGGAVSLVCRYKDPNSERPLIGLSSANTIAESCPPPSGGTKIGTV